MIRVILGFAGILLLAGGPAGQVQAEEPAHAGADLARVQGYLDDLESLEAEFVQVLLDADAQPVQRSSGSFRLLRPGRFSWDYVEPYEQKIVADGERLWIYDADLEQVTVRALDASLAGTPAMLLSGDGRIEEGYELQGSFVTEDVEWTALAPRMADTDFQLVRLGFRDAQLAVMELVDSLGQTTHIEFSDLKRNPALPAELFRFEPPEGVDVIGEDEF